MKHYSWIIIRFGAMLFFFSQVLAADTSTTAGENIPVLPEAFATLKSNSFKDKQQAIEQLIVSPNVNTKAWLSALLDGELYYQTATDNTDDAFVIFSASQTLDAASLKPITGVTKQNYKKITVNNRLRGQLRTAIAEISLKDQDANVRLAAVNALLDKLNPETVNLFRQRLPQETNPKVQEALQSGITLANLQNGTKEQQLAAIHAISDSLHPIARVRLQALSQQEDYTIATAAKQSLKRIEKRLNTYANIETLFFGLSLGSVLVLAAIGLAITFGVMGVINMAHGELIMLGAYTTYLIQQLMPNWIDLSLFIAIPAAFMVSAAIGILIERTIIRHLYGRPLETLLATFGVSLILQQFVRTVISPQNVPVANPSWMSGSWEINSVLSLTLNRLYIIAFCLLVFAALYYILRNTALGLQVRAVSQNRAMARSMGVRSERVDMLTFGLGSGVAGIAGVALSQLTNVGPNLGQTYIIDSFMVVVFGGVGNLWGTLVAGLSLGVFNKFLEPWAGAVLAKIIVLIFIILFIQKRPRGLFPQKGRAAEA